MKKMRVTLLRLQSDKLDRFDLYKSCNKTSRKTIDQIWTNSHERSCVIME